MSEERVILTLAGGTTVRRPAPQIVAQGLGYFQLKGSPIGGFYREWVPPGTFTLAQLEADDLA